jgi:acyl-CoA dehydrogenase
VKRKTDGLTLFYTKLDRTKVEVRLIHKMGRHGVDSNMLFFDGLEVPEEDRIGAEGEGFRLILHGLNPERILIAGEAVGIGQAALSRAANYARTREVFGRPIGQFQAVQHPLAEVATELEQIRLLTYKSAWLLSQGRDCATEAAMAKLAATETALRATDKCMRVLGGYGMVEESPMERLFRDARLGPFSPISNEMVKNFLGERMGLPKSY